MTDPGIGTNQNLQLQGDRIQQGRSSAAGVIIQIRRASQIVFLLLFTVLFLAATNRLAPLSPVPVDIFLRADPLVYLATGISSTTAAGRLAFAASMVVPVLVLLGLTVVLGRVFCGWICPLGTLIDIADRALYRKGRPFYRPRRTESRKWRNWKFLFLAAALISAVFTVQVTFLLDPISLLTRTFAFIFLAPAAWIWNSLLRLFEITGVQGFLYDRFQVNIGAWRTLPYAFRQNIIVLLMFAGIIALSAVQERFWCRNLCPLGALLGLLSRISILRHHISAKCNHCTLCERQSRMGAYEHLSSKDEEPETHSLTECIQCFRCATQCRPGALVIKPSLPFRRTRERTSETLVPAAQPQLDIGRRRLLSAAAVGAVWALTAKTNARAYPDEARAIRPPGAAPEAEFLAACTRCGECMRACITNGLQPALLETGLEGLWTPVLVPRIGACAEKCTACGQVCPTDAIRPFTVDQKKHIKLGLAHVYKDLCIAWNEGKDCIVCAEVCPYQAVIFKDVEDPTLKKTKRVPTVDGKLCTGCGLCEHHCPVTPNRAIIVHSTKPDRAT